MHDGLLKKLGSLLTIAVDLVSKAIDDVESSEFDRMRTIKSLKAARSALSRVNDLLGNGEHGPVAGAATNAASQQSPGSHDFKGKIILVVDDEENLRESVCHALRHEGATVLEAGNGRDALIQYVSNPVDVIVTDIRMPDGDGVELLDNVRANSRSTPVIFMTGYADLPEPEAYEKGADVIFSKPFATKELIETVRRLLQNPERTRTRKS